MPAEILSLDAGALLDGYREGTITPSEVTREALDRAQKLQPALNAFSLIDEQGAMEAADEMETRM